MISKHASRRLASRAAWMFAILCWGSISTEAEARSRRLPEFPLVEQAITKHFKSLATYQPEGIISRGDTKPVFKELEQIGWKVADQGAILDKLLPDGDYIIKLLRTKRGKWFAGKICKYPLGYDRFDRMARMPYGKNACARLVKHPKGYIMIRYMTTSSGGEILGGYLSNTSSGRNFNQPTGRIYTVKALLVELKKSYEKARHRR